ncbi:MAG: DUF3039 domain-containing protein [Actinobacteria bacterium]|jgi:hypothetical protein|nr:DUF3039 domain-containing protein [Actinomycetota bacterium]
MPDAPAPLTTIAPIEETVTNPVTGEGDHDRFAHYVRKADATRAAVEGAPVRALCGKVWVPNRDPAKYPVCQECTKIRERLLNRNSN